MSRIGSRLALSLFLACGARAALAAPVTVVVVDASSRGVDARLRRQVLDNLVTGLHGTPGLEARLGEPPRPEPGAKVKELLAEARSLSEKFEETQALTVLSQAEQAFRAAFGPDVSIQLLIQVLLARAKLHTDLGRTAAAEQTLARVVALDSTLTLDPGQFPPGLVRLFKRVRGRVAATTAELRVTTVPARVAVWIDGRERGESPLGVRLPLGEHFVAAGPASATIGQSATLEAEGGSVELRLPRAVPLADPELRAIAVREGAAWAVGVRLLQRGERYRVVARAVSSRAARLPRQVRTAYVSAHQLTWATSTLAVQLQNTLASRPAGPTSPPEPLPVVQREEPRPSVLRTWWFWTIVVAVVGGGTAAAVVLTRDDDPGVRVTLTR